MISTLMTTAADFSGVTDKITVEFPNLFNGMRITHTRGFELFGVSIYWYGVIITAGIVLAYLYAMRRVERDFGVSKDRAFDVVFVTTIGAFLCARIYYCVFTTLDPNSGLNYTLVTTFTKIHDGGIAIYGGVIGAALIGLLMCKIRKAHFRSMVDMAAIGFLLGQGIGRWGNFINQEAYGEACSKDFLFAMTGTRITAEMGEGVCVHPCFLYESVWCLLGFVLLHFYSKKLRTFDGEIALLYAAWYGFERFFVEGLRTDSLMAGDIRISQLVAAVSCAAAVVLFVIFKILAKKRGWVLYVNTAASKELLEHDHLEEEKSKSKKKSKKDNADNPDNADSTDNAADTADTSGAADIADISDTEGGTSAEESSDNEISGEAEDLASDTADNTEEISGENTEDKENGSDN